MNMKIIIAVLALTILATSSASAFTITADQVTETSISWNVTDIDPALAISAVSFDGVNLSGMDPKATVFIQSGLKPGEYHSIRVETSDTLSKIATAKTNASSLDTSQKSSNDQVSALGDFLNTWKYLILIVIFVIIGLARRLGFIEVIASIVSLYALAAYIKENDLSVTDIWHVNFLLYIFFFVFPYVIVYFKGGFTK